MLRTSYNNRSTVSFHYTQIFLTLKNKKRTIKGLVLRTDTLLLCKRIIMEILKKIYDLALT
ncbi:MAG: hypothetical protein AEth_01566 [Candidatus Argoarchaeum ethanivorans]|uniref:Uncharacterized protein n=1 Tax=Candidatus Argoarchaeum ethanivorans TaxID=2608793 RepID=A0A8B3S0E4_9EURY|nr:MAG: hypothetical protein AEth_01566 [Candidatus Argoarchaeum ethanivorans]